MNNRSTERTDTPPQRCLSVVMPCYNELATIDEVVDQVLASPWTSESSSSTTARPTAPASSSTKFDDPRVRVVLQPRQPGQGRGAAPRLRARPPATYVIVQDADLEYDPASTASCSSRSSTARPTSSSARASSAATPHRVLYFWHSVGNKLLTLLSNMFTNLNLTDMETCYKVFRREVIQWITLEEDRFGFEPEITAKVAAGRLADLRGRHHLRRPHLRRGQEDRLARRRAGPLLHRALLRPRRTGPRRGRRVEQPVDPDPPRARDALRRGSRAQSRTAASRTSRRSTGCAASGRARRACCTTAASAGPAAASSASTPSSCCPASSSPTLLLAEWRDTGTIALVSFWARRARRLLPAVFVLLVGIARLQRASWPSADVLDQLRGDGISHALLRHELALHRQQPELLRPVLRRRRCATCGRWRSRSSSTWSGRS